VTTPGDPSNTADRAAAASAGIGTRSSALIAMVFLGLGAWFLWGPQFVESVDPLPAPIDGARISVAPRRQTLGDPPTIVVGGAPRTCMDCHRLIEPSASTPGAPSLHERIRLDHGINDRCRNCHHVEDRDKLVLHDGSVVSFAESPTLCAKCHGPTYRDWRRGAHGRTNGYWDPSRGPVVRLQCSQCHDPHDPRRPAMEPIEPLPGPRVAGIGHVNGHDRSVLGHAGFRGVPQRLDEETRR